MKTHQGFIQDFLLGGGELFFDRTMWHAMHAVLLEACPPGKLWKISCLEVDSGGFGEVNNVMLASLPYITMDTACMPQISLL